MTPRQVTIPLPAYGAMNMLTRAEIEALLDATRGGLYEQFRRCVLAVLNTGSDSDKVHEILERHRDFDVSLSQHQGSVALELRNPPDNAFVDGQIVVGIQEHLHAVLRDILFVHHEFSQPGRFSLESPAEITDAVFHILRNARALKPRADSQLVVCWGGHSIGRAEYDYTKLVGYELGLRGLDICTGCGPGAMKGPMKGAAVGHSKQRRRGGRYVGLTEPGIIAAEAPNPIVNELVITPNIEMRLEAFVRLGHGFVVFPGGAGTAEELFYMLGILLHPENQHIKVPLVMTGPAESKAYFESIDRFLGATLGAEAQSKYRIIVDDPVEVARYMQREIAEVRAQRNDHNDALYFQWQLFIDPSFQRPFEADHAAMAALKLDPALPVGELAANLRQAFSGIVTANIKQEGEIATPDNPFVICGDPGILEPLEALLTQFVDQGRMTLSPEPYERCFRLSPES